MSQHLVSFIELLGLVVGLLGVFYLSGDFFGKSGLNLVRPILPTIAVILLAVLGYFVLSWNAFTLIPKTSPFRLIVLIVIVVIAVPVTYWAGYTGQHRHPSRAELLIYWGGIVASFLTAILSILIRGQGHAFVDVGLALFISLALVLTILPAYLTDRLVKNIGIVATLLAIIAQFLPPVLDLLNIPITKP